MSLDLDILSPATVGEDMIVLSLAEDTVKSANQPFVVNIDYSKAKAHGINPPLEVIFQGPDSVKLVRRTFYITPSSLSFIPRVGGDHLVLIRELFHYEWQGRLIVPVQGDFPITGTRR